MDKERQTIMTILDAFREGGHEVNGHFESDAEPFRYQGHSLLFTTDEFSEEDLFRDHDPFTLGWNLAAASISDIFACGGTPLFYGHCITVAASKDEHWVRLLARGIADCVKESGATFLGGDVGFSDKWGYTGIVIGRNDRGLSRKGACAGDGIYMTGPVGSGNLEAALKLYSNLTLLKPLLNHITVRFPLRVKESLLARNYANCCIDSSDGIFRAVSDLCDLSGTGFVIDSLPYRREALLACTLLNKPAEVLFLGECGEYELVFTVDREREKELASDAAAQGLMLSRIGTITGTGEKLLSINDRTIDLSGYELFARNYPDVKEYIRDIANFINHGT